MGMLSILEEREIRTIGEILMRRFILLHKKTMKLSIYELIFHYF